MHKNIVRCRPHRIHSSAADGGCVDAFREGASDKLADVDACVKAIAYDDVCGHRISPMQTDSGCD
jgi:hypothetical protein